MTLYVKNKDGTFSPMDPATEAAAVADPNSLFGVDSGFEVLLPAQDATAIKAEWAANAQAAANAKAPPTTQQLISALWTAVQNVSAAKPISATATAIINAANLPPVA
jgi:hypothetical protein